jgi:hypothetical protein
MPSIVAIVAPDGTSVQTDSRAATIEQWDDLSGYEASFWTSWRP